jgi:hypothetical protein
MRSIVQGASTEGGKINLSKISSLKKIDVTDFLLLAVPTFIGTYQEDKEDCENLSMLAQKTQTVSLFRPLKKSSLKLLGILLPCLSRYCLQFLSAAALSLR